MPKKGWTQRQERFVEEYAKDLNATQAAIRAGYTSKHADKIGWRILETPHVAEAIAATQAARLRRLGVTNERVLQETARLAFSDVRKFYDKKGNLLPITELDDDTAAAVAGMDVDEIWDGPLGERVPVGQTKKIKLWNKVQNLELLGKHLRLFVDQTEHTGPNGGPIELVYGRKDKTSLV